VDRGDKRRAEQAPACSLRAPPRPSSPLDCVQRRALTAAQPDRLALHLNIAACALRTADYDNAVFHATRALRTDPKNVKALFRRASAHLAKAGDVNGLEAALADLGRARELDPDNRDVAAKLAEARRRQKAADRDAASVFSKMVQPAEAIYS